MRHEVVVVRCEDYGHLPEALREGLEELGGAGRFFGPGERIFLKPNILGSHPPEEAVTTHPSLVEHMARTISQVGAEVVVGDSPGVGVPFTPSGLARAYTKTGIGEAAGRAGASLNYDTSYGEASLGGRLVGRANLLRAFLRADGLVNLPKAKTHTFTLLTASVKNLFGLVPGMEKTGYHAKLKDIRRFSQMLVDIAGFVRPRLTVLDAVVGMEGNGPSGGRPKRIGALLLGEDPNAVDVALCHVLGLEPLEVPTIRAAAEGGFDPEGVRLVGDEVRVDGFILPESWGRGVPGGFLGRLALPLVRDALTARPFVDPSKCTGCGTCARACPEGAISVVSGRAEIDRKLCIRCYCCQEVCPEGAVRIRKGWLQGRTT
ncbi:MAG: hypothetical protein DRQ14_05385 [Candidatus Latescibacterota bacterium]|nr:MAG: hypothetical protein DRQ14_05385 [Candidatus Latescibacterota bacterium]